MISHIPILFYIFILLIIFNVIKRYYCLLKYFYNFIFKIIIIVNIINNVLDKIYVLSYILIKKFIKIV